MELVIKHKNAISDSDIALCLSLMNKQRKDYIKTVTNVHRKTMSICAEFVAKKLISKITGRAFEEIDILRTEKGKPYLKDDSLFISISHSGDFVAVAADTVPIGIDIEEVKVIDLKIAKRVCTISDLEFLYSGENLLGFYKIWTAKEAYFKMKGTGITDLKSISYNKINAVHQIKDNLLITTVTEKPM